MSRGELLKAMVKDAIANDYEHLDQITEDVTNWAREHGFSPSSSEIMASLEELLRTGQAGAFRASQWTMDRIDMPLSISADAGRWYRLTKTGKDSIVDYDLSAKPSDT